MATGRSAWRGSAAFPIQHSTSTIAPASKLDGNLHLAKTLVAGTTRFVICPYFNSTEWAGQRIILQKLNHSVRLAPCHGSRQNAVMLFDCLKLFLGGRFAASLLFDCFIDGIPQHPLAHAVADLSPQVHRVSKLLSGRRRIAPLEIVIVQPRVWSLSGFGGRW